jgi:tRNA (cytidine56-2'-O)-methyltransferase
MIIVLRLSHRVKRDKRISTHCGLVARAFGADKIVFSGEKDTSMINSLRKVRNRWGGSFVVEYKKDWRKFLKSKKEYKVVNLSMYGLPVQRNISKIRRLKNLIIIIGSEKVPSEVYELADFNISVSNQPHSEVSSLSIFLDRYFKGKELTKRFSKAKLRIVPQKKGKKVIKKR